MGSRLQAVFGALILMGAGLLLGGCSDDIGLDQHGQKVATAGLENQWLVINYWAEWCGPCRTEIPELNALAGQSEGKGVRILGVNFDGLQGPNWRRPRSRWASPSRYSPRTLRSATSAARAALPVTYIIDPQGKVRERLMGEQTAAGLNERLVALKEGE